MSKFIVQGGGEMEGQVKVKGSKNAAFPVIAASILTNETCEIENVPDIVDVENFLKILKWLGAKVSFSDHKVKVNTSKLKSRNLSSKIMGRLRGSIVYAGPLLARFGQVSFGFPGGDAIGARPIDVHLDGFRRLGAEVLENKEIEIKADKLKGAKIVLGVTSVTGTENLILASVLAEGVTEIRLAAAEPHVQELCRCLIKMGAQIEGVGTPSLTITGVKSLKGVKHKLGSDEIETMTFAVAAAATKSKIEILDVNLDTLDAPLAALERMGVRFITGKNKLTVQKPKSELKGTRIITGVYPQLLTDEQPLFSVLATQAVGKTSIHDWIYEGRQGHLRALEKMGAKVEYDDVHRSRIHGPVKLAGVKIRTPDIRAGASILIASLVARGESIIYNAEIIDRGYENLDKRLAQLGADIKRVG